jgi:magnesium transporter
VRRSIVSKREGGELTHCVDDATLCAAMKAPDEVLWLDVEDPTEDDFKLLLEGFGFHPLSIEDVRQTHTTAKLDEYDHYVFQVVMVPRLGADGESELLEVEIFYLAGTLVTVHDEPWDGLEALWQAALRDPKRELGRGAQGVYHSLVRRAVRAYFPVLDDTEERVEALERSVFDAHGTRRTLEGIFALRRGVRALLRATRNQREGIQRLASGTVRSLRKETCYQFRDVYDDLILLHDALDDHRETLSALRDTYLGVVSNRMNEVMKTLTVFNAVLLPLTFLAGLWGMNFSWLPIAHDRHGFWIFLGVCAAIASVQLLFMARRGWLRRAS